MGGVRSRREEEEAEEEEGGGWRGRRTKWILLHLQRHESTRWQNHERHLKGLQSEPEEN